MNNEEQAKAALDRRAPAERLASAWASKSPDERGFEIRFAIFAAALLAIPFIPGSGHVADWLFGPP